MAQAMASMAGLRGTSQAVLEGSLGSNRFNVAANNARVALPRSGLTVRAHQQAEPETSRRAMLGLVAAGLASGSFVQAVLAADAIPIKVGPPPPPSGGLPGTLNADEARDTDLPLGKRFYLQPLSPSEAAARAKESAKEIVAVKEYIDKKAWPYVQNDLRTKSGYFRFDLKTVLSAKPREERQALKALVDKLFDNISQLDHAAKVKSTPEAEKYYAATVSSLNDVLSKLG